MRPRILRLVLLRHVIDKFSPLKLASIAPRLVRAVLDGRQPIENVVSHNIFPASHEASVPRMFMWLRLHDDIRASFRAPLYGAQDWPVIVISWLFLR